MKYGLRKGLTLGIVLFIILGSGIGAKAQSVISKCKRDKLKTAVETYFGALESHNPSSLSLSETVKFTENGKEMDVEKGFGETAGKALLKRSVFDEMKCSSHTQAVIEEAGRPIIYGVRLKLDGDKISEIETFVAREKEFAFNAKGLLDTKDQDWESILPLEQRSSRLAMWSAPLATTRGAESSPRR